MSGTIAEPPDSAYKIAYMIKYDMKQNRIVSIEKIDKISKLPFHN
jgi:hypothetical protein